VRAFRSSRSMVVLSVGCAALFIAVAIVAYLTRGASWVTIVPVGLAIFGAAGVLDVLTQRVELHEDRLIIVRNFKRREYPRKRFVKAQWAKGVSVSLQTTTGEWVHLPAVGGNSQGLVNTLRAWIRKE
jgi:hypothetical protein